MLKVIKRDCSEVDFDKSKISTAILKAMKNGSGIVKQKIAEDLLQKHMRDIEVFVSFREKTRIQLIQKSQNC